MDYKGKFFSILGDSISTLEGYSQPDFAAFYDRERKLISGVLTPADTWWGQVVQTLQGRVLVNNSFAGSTVCKLPGYEIESYGCSDERTGSLHCDDRNPDVIFVYIGTNDWGRGIPPEIFSEAYGCMLKKLQKNYPHAEIWCFTLAVSLFADGQPFPCCYRGRHMEEYCNVIRDLAKQYGCRLIDLYSHARPYETIDDFHPNARGMQALTNATLRCLG